MLEGFSDIGMARILIAVTMLGLASAIDLKKREINDMLWIGFSVVAVLLLFASPDFWTALKTLGLSMIVAPVALILWRFGIFGGADALCLIVLAALAPMTTLGTSTITPFTTLTNAALLSIIPIFVNITRNLTAILKKEDIFKGLDASIPHKAMAFCIGYKAKNSKYNFSIERMDGVNKKLDFSFKHAENTAFSTASDTWVTPGIPYILFITGGFVIQMLYGDVIFNMMHVVK